MLFVTMGVTLGVAESYSLTSLPFAIMRSTRGVRLLSPHSNTPGSWQQQEIGNSEECRADFNGDNLVSVSDFNLLKRNFGLGSTPPLRPEK